jgi:hypothetical protein
MVNGSSSLTGDDLFVRTDLHPLSGQVDRRSRQAEGLTQRPLLPPQGDGPNGNLQISNYRLTGIGGEVSHASRHGPSLSADWA